MAALVAASLCTGLVLAAGSGLAAPAGRPSPERKVSARPLPPPNPEFERLQGMSREDFRKAFLAAAIPDPAAVAGLVALIFFLRFVRQKRENESQAATRGQLHPAEAGQAADLKAA